MKPKPANWDIQWTPREGGRAPQVAPNPQFPKGKPLLHHDEEMPSCQGNLPYVLWPERGLGLLIITCRQCGLVTTVTTAGRPDDPTSLTQNCKRTIQ